MQGSPFFPHNQIVRADANDLWRYSRNFSTHARNFFYIPENEHVEKLASKVTEIDTDDSTTYVDLKEFVPGHNSQVIPKEKVGEILPWVHIAISNTKRQLLNTHHDIKPEFLQKYLDEFCHKFNQRYAGEALFNRLLVTCVSCKNDFRYKCR